MTLTPPPATVTLVGAGDIAACDTDDDEATAKLVDRSSPEGVREFVVGTGGRSLYPLSSRGPNSEAALAGVHGVLQLTLAPDAYSWRFIATDERVLDEGRGSCH